METATPKSALWNSSFIRICVYALFCQLTMNVSNTVMPLYVINELGYSNAQSGLLGTVFTIACMLCRFVTGGLSDKLGRKAMLIAGALIVGGSLVFMGFASALMLILVIKAFQGIGHSFNTTASNAAAADVLPEERIGEGISYFGLNSAISSAIGPTISLALMSVAVAASQEYNYSLPLIFTGLLGFAAAGLAATLNYEKRGERPKPAVKEEARGRPSVRDYIELKALMPSLLQLMQSFATGASVFAIVFANQMEFDHIQAYYILTAAVTLGTRLIMGRRMDQLNLLKITLIPLALAVAGYSLLGYASNEAAFMVNGALSGIFGAMLMPTFNSLAIKLSPSSRRGAASATYWLGFDSGMAAGQIVFGAIIDGFGFSAMYYSVAAYLALFGVVTFFALKKRGSIKDIQPV